MLSRNLLCVLFVCSTLMSWSQNKVIPSIDTLSRYIYRSEFAKAQKLAYERLQVKDLSDNERAHIYIVLSDVERLLTHPKLGIDKAFKAVRILNNSKEAEAKRSIPYAYHRIANIYFERRFMDSSLAYAIKSNDLARSIPITPEGIDRVNMLNLPIITDYYLREKKYNLAREAISDTEKLLKRYNAPCELALNQLKYADLERELGNIPKAIEYAKKGLAIADSCQTFSYQGQALNELMKLSLAAKDAKGVYEYALLKDDLFSRNRIEKQQSDIRALELRHSEDMQKRRNLLLEDKYKLQRNLNYLYICVLVLAITAILILWYMSRKLKQNIKQLEAQRQETERLNQLNRRIFSVISHDFKAPLSNLQMGLDLLHTDGLAPEDFKNISNNVRKQMTQSQLMMDNLMNWAQNELSETDHEHFKTSPAQIAQYITTELEALIEQKSLRIYNTIPHELEVNCHPETLKIVYRNLINNAIKYSFDHGKITLGYLSETQTLYVSDEGIGLDENLLKQLFKSTVISSNGTKQETGYGLGLHMIDELIKQMGGQIWAETNIPKGLVAKLKLPVVEA